MELIREQKKRHVDFDRWKEQGGHREKPKSIFIFLDWLYGNHPWLPGSLPGVGVSHEKLDTDRCDRAHLFAICLAHAPRRDYDHLGNLRPDPVGRRGDLRGADDTQDLAGVSP